MAAAAAPPPPLPPPPHSADASALPPAGKRSSARAVIKEFDAGGRTLEEIAQRRALFREHLTQRLHAAARAAGAAAEAPFYREQSRGRPIKQSGAQLLRIGSPGGGAFHESFE